LGRHHRRADRLTAKRLTKSKSSGDPHVSARRGCPPCHQGV
jgi:hypothetical protein